MAKAPTVGRRGRKPAQNPTARLLGMALDFLSVIPDKKVDPNYLVIDGALLYVNNGLLKAGVAMGEGWPTDVRAKLSVASLKAVLARVGKELEITWEDDVVTFVADDFTANVDNKLMPIFDEIVSVNVAAPDQPAYPLNSGFRDAVDKVARLVSDTGDELLVSSIAVIGTSVIATKRHTLIEAWHGNNMPYGMIYLPKAFALALGKTTAEIISFAFKAGSFTVYFDNGGFLQTNTYDNAWAIDGEEADYAFRLSAQLLTDGPGDLVANAAIFSAEIGAVASVNDKDIGVQLGRIMTVDASVFMDSTYVGDGFVIANDRYPVVADLVATLKYVHADAVAGLPGRLLFWGENVRGAIIVDAPTAGAEPEPEAEIARPAAAAAAAGWGQPAELPAGGWGASAQVPAAFVDDDE